MSKYDDWSAQTIPWLLDEFGTTVTLYMANGVESGPIVGVPSSIVQTEELVEGVEGAQSVKYARLRLMVETIPELHLYSSVELDGELYSVDSIESQDSNTSTLLLSRRVRMREHKKGMFS